jgi:hypothetical protein
MTNLNDLYDKAENDGITVMRVHCPLCESIAVQFENGDCYIGMDDCEMSSAEETVHLAHEMGHCETGSFYNRYSKFDIISKHEYRADKWAIENLIPENELVAAFDSGKLEIWELAEFFNVTEEFMIKACEHYGYYHRAI